MGTLTGLTKLDREVKAINAPFLKDHNIIMILKNTHQYILTLSYEVWYVLPPGNVMLYDPFPSWDKQCAGW